MKYIETNSTPFRTNKFTTLNLVENSIVLIKKNKEVTSISLSELNKIYIKKYKFSFWGKIGLLSIILVPTFLFFIYLPLEILLFISILATILVNKMNTYKSYQLNLILYDGTFFVKNFNKKTKQDYINILYAVRKKKFENENRLNIQNDISFVKMTIDEEYLFSSLSAS